MRKYIVLAVVILVAGGIAFYVFGRKQPEATFKTAKVERGSIVSSVAATGNLAAVVTVQVGTQVSGTIQRLFVDFNSPVKKGQIIAQIDSSLFSAQVEQTRGNFLNAQASLQKAKADLNDAKRSLERNRQLLKEGIISQGDYDTADNRYEQAVATVKAAEGSVVQTGGAYRQAQTNLHYATIRSPVDGTVVSRTVDVGQTVAASFQTPTLFTIAQDLTKMQIEVSVDEADISRVQLGQRASFNVDAYPEQTFAGKVVQVRSAPVITQNVVTYVVVVNVDNAELKLKPGMTANVNIEVARKDDVLKLPPAALRFKPKLKEGEAKESRQGGAGSGKQQGVGQQGGAAKAGAPGKPGRRDKEQQVYVLKEGKPVAVPVKTGIGNNSGIELVEGPLKEGDEVIIEQQSGDAGKKKSGMGGPMGRPF